MATDRHLHAQRVLADYPTERARRLAMYATRFNVWSHVEWNEVIEGLGKPQERKPMTATQALPIGFDTETHRFEMEKIAPPLVCLSVASLIYSPPTGEERTEDEWAAGVYSKADGPALAGMIDDLLRGDFKDEIKVGHNTAFDLAVFAHNNPDLFPAIFQQLEEGKIHCTVVREKLLNLADTGKLDTCRNPDGSSSRIEYKLASLVKKYLGKDISESKTASDAWRTNYQALEDVSTADWPAEAVSYSIDDAKYPVLIWQAQEARRQQIIEQKGIDPLATQTFRTSVAFSLMLLTCRGFMVDPEAKAALEKKTAEALTPERLNLLVAEGILRPGSEPQPYANGAKSHVDGCTDPKNCDCPPKMTAAVAESVDLTKLRAFVLHLAQQHPDQVKLLYTEPSKRFPEGQLSVSSEWLEDHWHLSPVLEQYRHRQSLQKIVTTELPRMNRIDENGQSVTAKVVHPCYDMLKETGRTSSFASDAYPSFNCQNVARDNEEVGSPRNCFIARPGTVLFSVDYGAMELCTAAQTCVNLFGKSVLADILNHGIDPHAYLGSQLALYLDNDFRDVCQESTDCSAEQVYKVFADCKKHEDKLVRDFFKHYRTFAKPTGLGYPGGLGPATFVAYAKATYGIQVTRETAEQLREIWRQTFPEFLQYFDYINTCCVDRYNADADGRDLYCYQSPMGMYRAGTSYCACANGIGLQTPSAEGALMAMFNVTRASYDSTSNSPLYGNCWPIGFIHDEIIGEIPEDRHMHQRAMEISSIMVDALRVICPDVKVKAEPALMRRWDKRAEPVFDKTGNLIVWTPEELKK